MNRTRPDIKGEKNPRWNGGTSQYPNHVEMKRNRLIKLKEADCKCEVCGEKAFCIHHIDESYDNHDLDNLAVLCKKCHTILHTADKKKKPTSKYIRLYGINLQQMAEMYGGSPSRYANLHKESRLKDFLTAQKEQKKEPAHAGHDD